MGDPERNPQHDPVCAWPDPTVEPTACPYCELITAVRADERDQLAHAIETQRTDDDAPDTVFLAGWLRGMTDAASIVRRGPSGDGA